MKKLCIAMMAILTFAVILPSHIQAQPQPQAPKKLTIDDVIKLSKAGTSSAVIINLIKTSASTFSLSADDVLRLKKEKVSDKVIEAMMKSSSPSTPPAEQSQEPGKVILNIEGKAFGAISNQKSQFGEIFIYLDGKEAIHKIIQYPDPSLESCMQELCNFNFATYTQNNPLEVQITDRQEHTLRILFNQFFAFRKPKSFGDYTISNLKVEPASINKTNLVYNEDSKSFRVK